MARFARFILLLALICFCCSEALAFDILGRRESFVGPRYITLGFSLGYSEIAGYKGVSGGKGFGLEVSLGHEYSESLWLDFTYKFSRVGLNQNNPLDPTTRISSTLSFHSEILRLYYKFSYYDLQPYLYAGAGIYSFDSVDSKSGMSFPTHFQIPLGAGFLYYLYRNKLSFKVGLDWHILFGENQESQVLALINEDRVSFDVYSLMFTLIWHVF